MHSYNDSAGSLQWRLHLLGVGISLSTETKTNFIFFFNFFFSFPNWACVPDSSDLKRTIPYDYHPLLSAALYVQDINPLIRMEIIFLSMQYLALRSSGNETRKVCTRCTPQFAGCSFTELNTLNIGVKLYRWWAFPFWSFLHYSDSWWHLVSWNLSFPVWLTDARVRARTHFNMTDIADHRPMFRWPHIISLLTRVT